MKIINIIEESRFGGPQKRIAEVASLLQNEGVETHVICPRLGSERFSDKMVEENIPFSLLKLRPLKSNPLDLMKFLVFLIPDILAIKKVVKQVKPDVVHANSSGQIKGIIAAKISGIRSVWHLNDTHMPLVVRGMFGIVSKIAGDHYISASEKTQSYYQPLISREKEIDIIQAPVDTAVFDDRKVQPAVDILSLPGKKLTMVANISPVKGHEVFIRMAAAINARTAEEISFVIVGKSLDSQVQYEKEIMEMVSHLNIKNVYYLGGRNDVKEVLKASDLYVCSSHYESSPIAVWEALSMSLPVVSTDVGDVPFVFQKYKCGLVVRSGDDKALADQVLHLLGNEGIRKEFGNNARKAAVEVFDISKCAEAHMNVYYKL